MASTGKCEYCGSTITSEDQKCPHCGAANPNYVADTPRTVFMPRTIEELKEYCAERGMPLLRMRFFIDVDYRQPRAFGIYRDGDKFVVYKNKADGSRAVRYHGPDEAYAVKELFDKLLDECHRRGIYPDGKPASSGSSGGGPKSSSTSGCLVLAAIFIIAAIAMGFAATLHSKDGYYRIDSSRIYYRYGTSWYSESSSGYDDWVKTSAPSGHMEDYYMGSDFDSDWGGISFKSSDVWEDIQESHSSSSSDYDDWDSGDTDWDSDW